MQYVLKHAVWLQATSRIALAVVFAGAVGCGCESSSNEPSPRQGQADAGDHVQPFAEDSPALLDGWEKPALAIVLTGEQYGFFEPCGCTENQSGGMSRRADLFRQINERKWSLTAFDLGTTVRRARQQSRIKFETIRNSLIDMEYAAMLLGPEELRLDPDYLISQAPDSKYPECPLPFVAANVAFSGDLVDLGPAEEKVVTIDGVRVGVTGVLGLSRVDDIAPKGSSLAEKFSVTDPKAALPAVIERLEAQQVDLLVLLSHASVDESRELAGEFSQFDLVLSAGGPEDPDGRPVSIGNTMLVTVGQKGKYAGVVGYYPDAPDDDRLRFELVELDQERFQDTPAMIEHMRTYQDRLRDERLAATELPIAHPSGATYVGAEKCGECHTAAFAKWEETPHSHAYESLEGPREGQPDYGITRVFDAECLSCHVAGWDAQQVLRFESGFINEEFAANDAERELGRLLKGSQCESCHGPGSRHIELVDDDPEAARKEVRVTLEQAKKDLCYQCHDLDNSPNFDFDIYWKEIKHPGLD
jgi:hypothetical protein